MGTMVYMSLLWVMQDLYHQPFFFFFLWVGGGAGGGVLIIILMPKPYSNC